MVDVATLRITATSDADKARAELDALTASATKAERAAEGLADASAKGAKAQDGVAGAAARAMKAQEGVAGAAARAAAAQEDVSGSAARAAAGLSTASSNVVSLGDRMQSSAGHTANLVSQFNDIGVMLAAGQSPLQLAMQQGTQVSQVLTQMGGGVGALRAVGSALVGMLNPVSLATIGIIAFGSAAIQWFMSSGEAAESLEDQIDNLKSSIAGLNDNFSFNIDTGKMQADLDTIVEKYGAMNTGVREHIVLLNQAQAAAAGYASIDFMGAFADTFGTGWLTTRVDEVRQAFETTNDGARRLIEMMNAVGEARGIPAQRQAAEALRDEIYRVTGGIENMSAEQVQFALQVNNAVDALRIAETSLSRNTGEVIEATAQTAQWESAMAGVLSYINAIGASLSNISGTAISYAAARVETEALRAGKSLRESSLASARETARLEGEKRTAELTEQLGIRGKILGTMEAAAKQLEISQREELAREQDLAREREKEAAKAGRGGGRGKRGGSGLSREERQWQRDIEGLARELATESELLDQWYLETQDKLAQANEAELAMIGGHNEAKLRLNEEYQQRLAEINGYYSSDALVRASTFFGEMAASMQSGNEKMLRVARVFSAAQGLINSYLAYTEVLKDPRLPWYARIPAAVGVLSAGLGMVNAIKGVSSGGGASSGGGGGSGSGSSTTTADPVVPQDVIVELKGNGRFTADEVEDMLNQLQKKNKNGVNITVVRS